ncbi:MAG: nucleotidyl transferase AbiEii/AbiGii toxin family protein [Candidatus Omnitrophica bacterium]|nr:nucleotidyl transferase AbiEii/AbiGii toxin family protein [Candidatus Omnitrophota bacterium]
MIHKDKKQFTDLINVTVQRTGFRAYLLEKDYYLTLILSRINELSEDLIFKGGTCLNKIYYSYYRLSEDLDFSMRLPEYTTTRGNRRKIIQAVKDSIDKFAKQFDMRIDDTENPGRNESKQYIYYFVYKSAIQPTEQLIKFEIGLRFNPILETETREVKHKFLHPFTNESLFDGGKVNCLSLEEIVSEKLRAAALRLTIAPRDFYDLDFIIRQGFNLTDKKVLKLFVKKIEEGLPAPQVVSDQFSVYVLKCRDESFYIGQTKDLEQRLEQHENKEVSWTASRLPIELIHEENFETREQAVKRESDLKTGFGRKWLKRKYNAGHLSVVSAGAKDADASRQAGNGDPDLAKYKINLGRTEKEIKDMKSRIENELFDVLTVGERENFDLDTALKRINKVMKEV